MNARLSITLSKVDYLHFHPEWIDGGPHPMGPYQLPGALRQVMVSSVLRDLATHLTDPAHARELHDYARGMASKVLGGAMRSWDDGDDWCPTTPWHGPFPHGGGKPQPDPWKASWVDRIDPASLAPLIDGAARSLMRLARV